MEVELRVSADSHLSEQPTLWEKGLPAKYRDRGPKFPRIQLRTIGQLLAGVAIERPSGNVAVDETFKKAPKAKAKGGEQAELL